MSRSFGPTMMLALGAILVLGLGVACDRPAPASEVEARGTGVEAAKAAVLKVEGMTCTGCEIGVEHVLKKVPGVIAADANYRRGVARVQYDPSRADLDQLVLAIQSLGYSARPVERDR